MHTWQKGGTQLADRSWTGRGAQQGGFTLVEVLVAVLILAVGIIGAAGTHVAAQRTRHSTALMSAGVSLASALAERMRANAGPGVAGAANAYLQFRYDAAAEGAPGRPDMSCFGSASCSRAQLAMFDTYEVREILHANYPGARIVVCRDAKVWDGAAGGLTWDCAGGASAPLVIKLGWAEHGSSQRQVVPAVAIMVAGAFS